MNKEAIVSKLMNKKVQDYSFLVFFFLIFAVFVFFAIRPNLVTAFSLQKELEELQLQDEQYERVISNIVQYQTVLEDTRDEFYLFEEAIPLRPAIYFMVNDIRKGASESGIILNRLVVSEVNLKGGQEDEENTTNRLNPTADQTQAVGQKENTKSYRIEFDTESNFTETRNFVAKLVNQRRLKIIDTLTVQSNGTESTQSAVYRVSFVINGFYL